MRNVYFSFHYDDVWKVNQIRNSGIVIGARSAGFADRSLWEEAKAKNRSALQMLIARGLEGTSVTAVLIGRETASRPWVKYEIQESIARGNAIVGIHIHNLKDKSGRTARPGPVPHLLKKHNAAVHDWTTARDFGQHVEAAWRAKSGNDGFFGVLARALGL